MEGYERVYGGEEGGGDGFRHRGEIGMYVLYEWMSGHVVNSVSFFGGGGGGSLGRLVVWGMDGGEVTLTIRVVGDMRIFLSMRKYLKTLFFIIQKHPPKS